MKINGIPYSNNKIDPSNGKNTRKVSTEKALKRSDSVDISGSVTGRGRVDNASHVVETEFQPRAGLMEAVSERISNSSYSAPEVLENIAENVMKSNILPDVVESISMDQARVEKVEEVENNIENNYYDNPEIISEIASRILSLVVPSGLLGDSADSL